MGHERTDPRATADIASRPKPIPQTPTRNPMKTILALALLILAHTAQAFYEPSIGRWITRDPISELGGINLYQFVGNTPVNNSDPFGFCGDDCPNIDAWPKSPLDPFNKGVTRSSACPGKLTICLETCRERFFSGKCAKYYDPCVALCNERKLECDMGSSKGNDLPPRAPKIEVPPPKSWWQGLKDWFWGN